ncbi:MAG: hypothetical protein AB8I08_38185 [Sandaracinaceae bacterium]
MFELAADDELAAAAGAATAADVLGPLFHPPDGGSLTSKSNAGLSSAVEALASPPLAQGGESPAGGGV